MKRVAIVNRGEAAARFIRAADELRAAGKQITTIALYTDEEASSSWVHGADEAYSLGSAARRPYLDLEKLRSALEETRADSAWVGWGFVAENADFSALCEDMGVVFMGPSTTAMRQLGDKIQSKVLAERVGVPMAPWSEGPVATIEEAVERAAEIGYPVMLKASAGGGGRGIRKINDADELRELFDRTRAEALNAFGSDSVFLEKMVTDARHIEVQVIADGLGEAWALGMRDCSIQRRNQKVLEESSSPVVAPELKARVMASAELLLKQVDYAGAATVEFLFRPEDELIAFLEVNTRLQVEHPVTELTTGFDLVKAQIRIAEGEALTGPRPTESGYAIEARLNAEDPHRDFAPSPGHISLLRFPVGPGIRVDSGVIAGDTIPSDFDSMVAKIIAYGRDRQEAWARLKRALEDTTAVIDGGTTNKSFIAQLLNSAPVVDGTADTGWIDRERAEGGLNDSPHSGIAFTMAAICQYEMREAGAQQRFLATARGGRPQVPRDYRRPAELAIRTLNATVTVWKAGPHDYHVGIESGTESHTFSAHVRWIDENFWRLGVEGQVFRGVAAESNGSFMIDVEGTSHVVVPAEGGIVRAPATSVVVACNVEPGQEVAPGDPMMIVESMKMESVIRAPQAARVKEVMVLAGQQVDTGSALLTFDPLEDEDGAAALGEESASLELPLGGHAQPSEVRATPVDELAGRIRGVLLGFDDACESVQVLLDEYLARRGDRTPAASFADESEILTIFSDLMGLAAQRAIGGPGTTQNPRSLRDQLHRYMQNLHADPAALPEEFAGRLARLFDRHQVPGLDHTPSLERAMMRVYLATTELKDKVPVAAGILRDWQRSERPEGLDVLGLLTDLIHSSQLDHPSVSNLARSVRERWYVEPQLAEDRTRAIESIVEQLEQVGQLPAGPERDTMIQSLSESPENIDSVLSRYLPGHRYDLVSPLVEAIVRRYYWEYNVQSVQTFTLGERPWVVCDYSLHGRPSHLVATVGDLREALSATPLTLAIDHLASQVPLGHAGIVEVFLDRCDDPRSLDEISAALSESLSKLNPERVHRVVVGLVAPESSPEYLTFRPEDGCLVEDHLTRGTHPMIARSMNLWRLRDFNLERVPSTGDLLVYSCEAADNPSDRRLVAMAEIRQLGPMDQPHHEGFGPSAVSMAVDACFEAIRRIRSSYLTPPDHNHVWIHLRPPVVGELPSLDTLRQLVGPALLDAGIVELLLEGTQRVDGDERSFAVQLTYDGQFGARARVTEPPIEPHDVLRPLDDYQEKVLKATRRGTVYPYELTDLLAGRTGAFLEYDLDEDGVLVPAARPPGHNEAGIVVGLVSTPTRHHPDGITRVVLLGDPTKALGSLSEAECRRVIAAVDLAERNGVPLEWFTLSAGAKIAMDSGTENLDWVASALRRIVRFTQAGHQMNIVVSGINVGAQPYWNAESTMLMHTSGISIMTPAGAMVLTGKASLDFSGAVSAEDNLGIGGYSRVMGPNGQAQFWAQDVRSAIQLLMNFYDHSYVVPGEARPRRAVTEDPVDRDISVAAHEMPGSEFATVGEVFSADKNLLRKKPFDIRSVMKAVRDVDHGAMERWKDFEGGETAVVQEVRMGGWPVCLIGIESKPLPRQGFLRTDGPDSYSAGTLFPLSSKKIARAINAASGNRPVVILANLSGFDGSPESMRSLQLEYGAEIGRALVNFEGPIILNVLSRYHGGAFVVFSKRLNKDMLVLALAGSFASVIGGSPAASVVFTKEVERRTACEPELRDLTDRIRSAASDEVRTALEADYSTRWNELHAQAVQAVAEEFDAIHTIQRAVDVGSVDEIVATRDLRPRIIGALDGWLERNVPDGSPAAGSSPFVEVSERDVDDESLHEWLHMMKVAGRWRERRFAAPSPQPWFSVSPAALRGAASTPNGAGLHPATDG